MTDLLKRLEREGSIERRADPNNRRADRWYIRDEGQARLRSARSAGGPVMTQMLSLLSGSEIGTLRDYLERCVEGLERENRRDGAIPLPDCMPPAPVARKAPAARARTARRTAPRRRNAGGNGTVRR
jgi:hypothetical protein